MCDLYFEKMELTLEIVISTFDLATERILKQFVIHLLRYGLKLKCHMRVYFYIDAFLDVAM